MGERATGGIIGIGLATILALVILDPGRPPAPTPPPPPAPTPSPEAPVATTQPPSPSPSPSPPPSPSATPPGWTLEPGVSEWSRRVLEATQALSRLAGADLAQGGLARRAPTVESHRDLARRVADGDLGLPVRIVLDVWAAWLETNLGQALAPAPTPPPGPLDESAPAALAHRELAALIAWNRKFETLLENDLVRGLEAERADASFLERYRREASRIETAWKNTLSGLVGEEHTAGLTHAVLVLGYADGPLATRVLQFARDRLPDRGDEVGEPVLGAWLAALGRDLDGPAPPCADRLGALRELGFPGTPDAAAQAAGLFLRLSARCPEAIRVGDGARLAPALRRAAAAPAGRRAWLVRSRMGDFGAETAALIRQLEALETPSQGAASPTTSGLPPPRLGF